MQNRPVRGNRHPLVAHLERVNDRMGRLGKEVGTLKARLRTPTHPIYDPDFPLDAIDGQIAIHAGKVYYFWAGEWRRIAGAPFGAGGVSVDITQQDHGFVVGDVIRYDASHSATTVTFAADAQTANPGGTATHLDVDVPALAAGDLLILSVDFYNTFGATDNTLTAPGFTELGHRRFDNFYKYVLYRVLDGSEGYLGGGTVTATAHNTDSDRNEFGGYAIAYSGASASAPFETAIEFGDSAPGANGYSSTYETTSPREVIIQALFLQVPGAPGAVTFNDPAGGTVRQAHADLAGKSWFYESPEMALANLYAIDASWGSSEYGAVVAGIRPSGEGNVYVKAQADNTVDAEVVGIVTNVADADHFTLTQIGLIAGLAGLTPGTVYYLSPDTPGHVTATEPTTAGEVAKPLLIAVADNSAFFFNYRGEVVPSTGLSDSGSTFEGSDGSPAGAAGGDLTGTYPNPTLAAAGPGATGPTGDGTHIPVVTIDAKGRVVALTSVAVTPTGGAPTGAAGGALAGTYPNPTLADAELNALAALVSAADKVPYFTGAGTASLTTLSAFMRTLLDDVDAATAAATLGVIASGAAAGGDLTGTYPNPTLAAAGPGATGPIGDGTHVPVVTIDAKGRVTGLTSALITGAAPGGAAGGDLTGTYPNPTLVATGPGATGPIGDATHVAAVTIDAKGRVTALTSVAITAATVTDVSVTETPGADDTATGVHVALTAGEALAMGDPVYFKSDGKVWKADADTAGTFPAMGVAISTALANASVTVLLIGIARHDAWNWTVGGVIYLSTTSGLTQAQPAATDNAIQVMGVATHADRMYVNPQLVYITHI